MTRPAAPLAALLLPAALAVSAVIGCGDGGADADAPRDIGDVRGPDIAAAADPDGVVADAGDGDVAADDGIGGDPAGGEPPGGDRLPPAAGAGDGTGFDATGPDGRLSSDADDSDLPPLPDDVTRVTFEQLSDWEYVPRPDDLPRDVDDRADRYPERVLDLDGERIAILAHVLPWEWKDGEVRRMLLTPYYPSCCFGASPTTLEWVDVHLPPGVGDFSPGMAKVRVTGVLEVGEFYDDEGVWEAMVYRMQASKVEPLPE